MIPRDSKKYSLYLKAFKKILNAAEIEREKDSENSAKMYGLKLAWHGVKTVISHPDTESKKEAENLFDFISHVKYFISILTLKEFMQLFPIEKKYDGEKWEVKDYYSTVAYIQESGLEADYVLGDKALELIAEYQNEDIFGLFVKSMEVMSAIRRYEGDLDLFEEFQAACGEETTNTFKNSKGQAYYVKNGRPQKIKMINQQSRHLQRLK